jgi:hypothetical protein
MTLPRHQPPIPLLTQDTFTAVTLPDHVDIVIRNDRWRLDLAAPESKYTDLGISDANYRWRVDPMPRGFAPRYTWPIHDNLACLD